MLPALISHPDCLKHDMGAHHPECPQRLDAVHDQLLVTGLAHFMQSHEAPLATEEQLLRVHDAAYLRSLQDITQNIPDDGCVYVDPDTAMNQYSYQAALRAAGAAVLATDLVASSQAPVAFCNIRPPGHHAKRAAASGFCFFNNVVIGIRHALAVHGLSRVALIDFDVHHGDGSEELLCDEPRALMCSTFETGIFPFCGSQPMGRNMINVGLPSRSGGSAFRAAVTHEWLPALEKFRPQMLFVSAGFDGHREDDMGNLGLLEADYEWVTRQIMQVAQRDAQGRVVSCLEGGYVMSPLGRSVAAHVKVLIGAN